MRFMRFIRKEICWQDASPRSCLEAEERSSEAWNHFQPEYKERKSECPFVFRPFRTTASATTLEIIARLLSFFPSCVEGSDYFLRHSKGSPLAAVKSTDTEIYGYDGRISASSVAKNLTTYSNSNPSILKVLLHTHAFSIHVYNLFNYTNIYSASIKPLSLITHYFLTLNKKLK